MVEQSRCRTHRQQTTTIAQMQSQLSIHSPSPWGRGLGFRQGCRDRTPKGFMQGRIQVVEQSRCRTHRQQTTTIAETQSPQSVLIGIEKFHYSLKTNFFCKISPRTEMRGLLLHINVIYREQKLLSLLSNYYSTGCEKCNACNCCNAFNTCVCVGLCRIACSGSCCISRSFCVSRSLCIIRSTTADA